MTLVSRRRALFCIAGLGATLSLDARAQQCPQPTGKSHYAAGNFYMEFLPAVETPDSRGALAASIASMAVPRDYWKRMLQAVNDCHVDTTSRGDPRTFLYTLRGVNVGSLPANGVLELIDRFGNHLSDVKFQVVNDTVSMTLPLFRSAIVIPNGVLTAATEWTIRTSFPLLHNKEGPRVITSGWNWRGIYVASMTVMVVGSN